MYNFGAFVSSIHFSDAVFVVGHRTLGSNQEVPSIDIYIIVDPWSHHFIFQMQYF